MTEVREPWQAEALQRHIPPGALLISTCWQTIPGRALAMAPDDIEALGREKIRARLPDGRQVVMSLRVEDFHPEREPSLVLMAEATDGGLIVVGVTYEIGRVAASSTEECPECASPRQQPSDVSHLPELADGRARVLQCVDCGSAWDA